MDTQTGMPELAKFNPADYFEDFRLESKVKLCRAGIELVGQYYASKYKTPELIIIDCHYQALKFNPNRFTYLTRFFQMINSETFSEIKKREEDTRLPIILTGWHSTPIIYIKEGSKEGFLVFDSMEQAANDIAQKTQFEVYTVSGQRQRDFHSCHTDALVFIRELTGKDKQGHYLIPNFMATLENEKRLKKNSEQKNLTEVALPNRLLITTQRHHFMTMHRSRNRDDEIVHTHKGRSENIDAFLKRYPPDETISGGELSTYLHTKGFKLANIVEIQFYINQLKYRLGSRFNETIRENFIINAKALFKTHGNSFFTEMEHKQLYKLAQKCLKNNFNLSETVSKQIETDLSTNIKGIKKG